MPSPGKTHDIPWYLIFIVIISILELCREVNFTARAKETRKYFSILKRQIFLHFCLFCHLAAESCTAKRASLAQDKFKFCAIRDPDL